MKYKSIYPLLLCAATNIAVTAESPYSQGIQLEIIGSHDLAVEQYHLAANSGLNDAKVALGRLYRDVYGDMTKSLEWFLDAANHGNGFAQYEVGIIYTNGSAAASPDHVQAVYWLTMAANKRHKAAAYHLFKLANTLQIQRDWLEKAADLGHIKAMSTLADAYETGAYGFPIDQALSNDWSEKVSQAQE